MPMTLQQISDRLEIEDLLTRYVTSVDTKDWDRYRTCFTEDAVIDYVSSGGIRGGVDEVTAWVSAALEHFPVTQHLTTNIQLTIEADSARSRCYFFNPLGGPSRPDGTRDILYVGGYYRDVYRRTANGWLISERVEDGAWFDGALPANLG